MCKSLSQTSLRLWMVPAEGFEPPTPGSEDRCSNPLSYAGTTK